jgi:hypothetical protein
MAASSFSLLEKTAACTVTVRSSSSQTGQTSIALDANWNDTAQGISGASGGQTFFFPWSMVLEVRAA